MSRFEGIGSYAHTAFVGVVRIFGGSACSPAMPEPVIGGAHHTMTENERRNGDVLTREDVLVRGFSAVGIVTLFLLVLLMVNP
jgi:hypothetical protein